MDLSTGQKHARLVQSESNNQAESKVVSSRRVDTQDSKSIVQEKLNEDKLETNFNADAAYQVLSALPIPEDNLEHRIQNAQNREEWERILKEVWDKVKFFFSISLFFSLFSLYFNIYFSFSSNSVSSCLCFCLFSNFD